MLEENALIFVDDALPNLAAGQRYNEEAIQLTVEATLKDIRIIGAVTNIKKAFTAEETAVFRVTRKR